MLWEGKSICQMAMPAYAGFSSRQGSHLGLGYKEYWNAFLYVRYRKFKYTYPPEKRRVQNHKMWGCHTRTDSISMITAHSGSKKKKSHPFKAQTWITYFLYANTRDGYRARKKEIITKQDTAKQKRQTNQHRDSRQLKRPSKRDWSFSTGLLCVWILAKYTVIFLFLIFTQPPIQSSIRYRMQISSFESG